MSPQSTLDNTWGAALIGLILAATLYGITTLQVYIYFTLYPNDPRWIKILASVTWLIDTVSLCLVCNGMYGYLVSDMANPASRLVVNRSFDLDPLLMGLLAFLTHAYLGARFAIEAFGLVLLWYAIYRLFKAWMTTPKKTLLSISALALAIASSIISFRFKLWTQRETMKPLALAGTIIIVVIDTLIALVLCIYLSKQDVEGKGTRRVVRRVLIFAINTGLASCIMSTINVVTFLSLPNTLVFLGTDFIFTKVYANALLANLNARQSLRGQGYVNDGTMSINLSALRTNQGGQVILVHAIEDEQPITDITAFDNGSERSKV